MRVALGFAGKLGLKGVKLALNALNRLVRPLQAFFGGADGTFESGGAPFVLTPGDHVFGRKFRRN